MKKHLFALVAAAIVGCTAPAAKACDGPGWGLGFGYGWGNLYGVLRHNVPHYAAFPPVYYSHPVPRSYGYSPFAYPPYVMTPEVVMEAAPLEIVNPYVPSSRPQEVQEVEDRTAATRQPTPQVIHNPYVGSENSVAQAR